MARLPDRFDLWVRKARACADPERQIDYVLGALAGLREWHFINLGTKDMPRPAETEIERNRCLLIFTDTGRIAEVDGQAGVISIPSPAAMAWCVKLETGLMVNPPEDAVLIPAKEVRRFHEAWANRGGRQTAGFWIPNLTSEEEDFWQEHGL